MFCTMIKKLEILVRMQETLSISEVREKLAEVTGRVQFTGERIVMQKHGKTVAVLVPPSDLEALEALEDRLDLPSCLIQKSTRSDVVASSKDPHERGGGKGG